MSVVYTAILKSRHFFLKRGRLSQKIVLEDITGCSGGSLLEGSTALSDREHGPPSLTAAAARWWGVIAEKYGKNLESLLPSREIPAEELDLPQSAEKQHCQTQPCLTVVKQTICWIFWKTSLPDPSFTISLARTRGPRWLQRWHNRSLANSRSTLRQDDFRPTDESNSDTTLRSNRGPYLNANTQVLF